MMARAPHGSFVVTVEKLGNSCCQISNPAAFDGSATQHPKTGAGLCQAR